MKTRAVLLLASLTAPCGAQESAVPFQGRLFTTPVERSMLDGLRQAFREEAMGQKSVPRVPEREPVLPAEPLRIDGVVVRSGGPDTVWVDGEPVTLEGAASPGIRIEDGADAPGSVSLRVSKHSQRVHLKPGQRYDPETGRVTEAFPVTSAARGLGLGGP